MSTQLAAIMVVLGAGLLFLLVAWSALAVSSREEEEQARWLETMAAIGRQKWQAFANGDYQDETEHDDG